MYTLLISLHWAQGPVCWQSSLLSAGGDGACPDPRSCPLGGGGGCYDGDLALKVPCHGEVGGSTSDYANCMPPTVARGGCSTCFREANGAADHLAKEATSLQLTRVLHHDDITGVLRGILCLDRQGVPRLRRG
ncbi:UNVERIFIED_CONTAM: hypothetical protein Sradi_4901500 [Sesamum radiatum]|uniref:Gnk2-homologous domain-containing protein n=1 Tax=Sesamum radiatum TaxID=300843 RepID=A0AAW2MDR9_SESRA